MSVWQRIRSRGILYTLGGKFNDIVPAKLFRFRVFKVFRLAAMESDPSPQGAPTLDYRWCETDADTKLAQQLTFFRSEDEDRSARFRACLASLAGEVVGGVWQGTKFFDEDELGVRIILPPDQAWIFAAFVAKSQRGQRIYPRLLNHVLREDHRLTHYASINTTNRASIAAHRHFVESETGRCIALRILSVSFCWAGRSLSVSRHVTMNCQRIPIEITFDC